MKRTIALIWIATVWATSSAFVPLCPGQESAADGSQRELVVGTRHVPPFSIRGADDVWSGLSIELWRWIAQDLGLSCSFVEVSLDRTVEALRSGSVDAAVAALTITAEREEQIDFSHSFMSTGLAIAVSEDAGGGWGGALRGILRGPLPLVLAVLVVVLLLIGALVWLLERRRNPGQFGGDFRKGIGSGVWWSAVTLTTVGYGDKAPVTGLGRLVAIIWMFAGLFIISAFTAATTSALTVSRLESKVRGPEDLVPLSVACVRGSTSEIYLRRNGIRSRPESTVEDGLAALQRGAVDAMVHDAPILRYLVQHGSHGSVRVLPPVFEPQEYGIALADGSPLREAVNRALLHRIDSPKWRELLREYLGSE